MTNPKLFVSKRKTFQFEYPADWEILIAAEDEVVISAPVQSDFPPSVQITLCSYRQPMGDLLDELHTNLQSRKPSFKLTQKRLLTLLNGRAAGELMYQHTLRNTDTTEHAMIIRLAGELFILAFAMAPTALWRDYQMQFGSILNSIQIPDEAQTNPTSFWKRLSTKIGL